jgi:hypothetical protein
MTATDHHNDSIACHWFTHACSSCAGGLKHSTWVAARDSPAAHMSGIPRFVKAFIIALQSDVADTYLRNANNRMCMIYERMTCPMTGSRLHGLRDLNPANGLYKRGINLAFFRPIIIAKPSTDACSRPFLDCVSNAAAAAAAATEQLGNGATPATHVAAEQRGGTSERLAVRVMNSLIEFVFPLGEKAFRHSTCVVRWWPNRYGYRRNTGDADRSGGRIYWISLCSA